MFGNIPSVVNTPHVVFSRYPKKIANDIDISSILVGCTQALAMVRVAPSLDTVYQ